MTTRLFATTAVLAALAGFAATSPASAHTLSVKKAYVNAYDYAAAKSERSDDYDTVKPTVTCRRQFPHRVRCRAIYTDGDGKKCSEYLLAYYKAHDDDGPYDYKVYVKFDGGRKHPC